MRRLVVVAVEQYEIALGDQRGQHDLVGGGSAVEDEIGLLGAENGGGFLLRLQSRSLVHQEIAQFEHRVVEVVAEHRLAEMFHEDAPDRAAAVEDAAIVARTGPELVALLGEIGQRAEKRRLQCFRILLEPADQILGDKFRGFLSQENVAVDEIQHLDRNVLEALAPHQQHDRHLETAPPHQVDQGCGLAFQALLAPIDHHAADRGVGLDGDLRVLRAPRLDDLEPHLLDRRHDLLKAQAFEIIRIEHRSREKEGKALEIIHVLPLSPAVGGDISGL